MKYMHSLVLSLLALLSLFSSLRAAAEPTVKSAVDGIVARLYETKTPDEMRALTHEDLLAFITPEERQILATRECVFDVDVPVVVSVIRSAGQQPVPFWLEEAGFKNTGDKVVSEWSRHEVWRKHFEAGTVALGINGFDNERKAYFVCVAPQAAGEQVTITGPTPEAEIVTVGPETWTYKDWDNLYMGAYPAYLEGQQLITTYR